MKRRLPWSEPLPGSVFAWMFAVLFLVFAVIIARLSPVLLVAPSFAVAALLVPPLRGWRTGMFVGFLILGALGFTLPYDLATVVIPTMLLCAAMLLCIEVAYDHGVGVPVGRFLRSRKVQGWATVVLGVPFAAFGVLMLNENLKRSGLSNEWRWSLVPLVLLMVAPKGLAGVGNRFLWAAFPVIVALCYWVPNHKDKAAEALFRTSILAMQLLGVAGWIHEGFAKIRPKPPRDDGMGSRPIRVHSGGGLP